MKFKYVYQLFLSQFLILLLTCLTIGLLVSHFMRSYFYESQSEELTRYGQTIAADLKSVPKADMLAKLESYQRILDVNQIRYTILTADSKPIFPHTKQPLPKDFSISAKDLRKLKNKHAVTIKVDDRFNQEMSVVYVPLIDDDNYLGSIVLNSPISGTNQVIATINQYMFYTILLSLIIALVLSALLAKLQVNRIDKIRRATQNVINGDYEVRLKTNNVDEISALAIDFNIITENLKRSEEEIIRQEKQRQQFIADVSHEMRTPLTTISGLTEGLVNDVISSSETERCISLIDKEARRLTKLVNENLDYERIRSNKMILQKTSFSAKAFLELIKEQLDYSAKLKKNQIEVIAPIELQLYADYDRLTQVLINIVKNSIQFTTNGTIYIKAVQAANETTIEISDTGIGMNPYELEQIWDRFYKADISRTSTAFGESGIGLAIVKQLINYHQGTINVKSQPNCGTTFIISLPILN